MLNTQERRELQEGFLNEDWHDIRETKCREGFAYEACSCGYWCSVWSGFTLDCRNRTFDNPTDIAALVDKLKEGFTVGFYHYDIHTFCHWMQENHQQDTLYLWLKGGGASIDQAKLILEFTREVGNG